ncbi:MAG: sigma-70 family RNA polymerase sigma factor [Thermoleophilia bacterium]
MPTPSQRIAPDVPAPSSHHGDLVCYARRMLRGDTATAEDVVQEAYLRLAEHEAVGSPPRDARPWLFRVVKHLALDERRRAHRAVPVAQPPLEAPPSAGPVDVLGPVDLLTQRHAATAALREVAALPPREREAVVLEQAGVAPAQIARELEITPNAVHQALFRARRRLRTAFAGVWGLAPVPVARQVPRWFDGTGQQLIAATSAADGGRLVPAARFIGMGVAVALAGGAAVTHAPLGHRAAHHAARHVESAARPAPGVTAPTPRRAAAPVSTAAATGVAHTASRTGTTRTARHRAGPMIVTTVTASRPRAATPARTPGTTPVRPPISTTTRVTDTDTGAPPAARTASAPQDTGRSLSRPVGSSRTGGSVSRTTTDDTVQRTRTASTAPPADTGDTPTATRSATSTERGTTTSSADAVPPPPERGTATGAGDTTDARTAVPESGSSTAASGGSTRPGD